MLFGDINLDNLGTVDGNNWVAVGTSSKTFQGTFDGNGYTISNLKINKPTTDGQGFFGWASGATIKNTSLENVDVKGDGYTGGLVGRDAFSTIQNSYSTGDIIGNNSTGGLTGYLYSSTIQNSYSACNVVGSNSTGGLAGLLYFSTIKNSYSTGNVTGSSATGGLVGEINRSAIQNSYSTGNGAGAGNIGGLVGCVADDASITNSYSTGQNKATIGARGGFIGEIATGKTLTLNNYAYATQTTPGVANGNGVGKNEGTILGTQQTSGQNADWFAQTPNINGLIGKGSTSWDFLGTSPVLKWQIKPTPKNNVAFQIGTDGSKLSAIAMDLGFGLGNFKPNFSSATSSRKIMEMCDNLLKQINTKRGEIGANTNIISSIVDGNTITNENLTASKSRIQDADIARESATMVKNQILEQATSSLLSQSSNMNGQLALQLLSGLGGRR